MKRVGLLLLGLATAFAFWHFYGPRKDAPAPPQTDLSRVHPLVAGAIRQALSELSNSPDSPDAWGNLGMVYIAHRFPDEARQCFREASRLDDQDFRWPYFTGYSHEESDYGKALENYLAAARINPRHVPLNLRIGQIYLRQGEVDRCEKVLLDSLVYSPEQPQVLMTLGQCALLRDDLDAAQELLIRASAAPGWSPWPAYRELVKLALRRGDPNLAHQYRQKLAGVPETAKLNVRDPVLEQIQKSEGLLKDLAQEADFAMARGDLTNAISAYQRFLEQRPDLSTAYINLAQAHSLAGHFEESVAMYEECIRRFGGSVAAHYGLAVTCERAGKLKPAEEHCRKALRLKPTDKSAHFVLGLVQEQQGNREAAVSSYRASIRADPTFAQSHLALGVALLEQGQLVEARECIERAAILVPGDPVPKQYLRKIASRQSPAGP